MYLAWNILKDQHFFMDGIGLTVVKLISKLIIEDSLQVPLEYAIRKFIWQLFLHNHTTVLVQLQEILRYG